MRVVIMMSFKIGLKVFSHNGRVTGDHPNSSKKLKDIRDVLKLMRCIQTENYLILKIIVLL